MSQVHVINAIRVPRGMEAEAEEVRDIYVAYFERQPGFVSSTFFQASDDDSHFDYINIVVWASEEAMQAVVNQGFDNSEGLNADGMKVLGKGFPEPIQVAPGRYRRIRGS